MPRRHVHRLPPPNLIPILNYRYLKNIGIVDKGISKFVARLEDFYGNDHSTAYVFTADHGMSDRGSHGDGHPDNTQTPIIAWGAGIRKPIKASQETDVFPDNYSEDWQMSNLHRSDVNQADIAPFMSTLIGVPYPKNSVGVLPLDYLDNTESYKARAAFGNAKQILAQFVVKETSKRRTELLFQPFKGLVNRTRFLDEIEGKISKGDYLAAERASVDLVQITLDGLRYYQTYDWLFLRSIISTGYLGWIVYSSIFIIQKYSIEEKRSRQASQKTQKQGWVNRVKAIITTPSF